MAGREANIELLKLAGFEGEELEAFLPDWLKTMDIVGLSDEDVRYATEVYIPANWDVQYLGIRKCIGAYFRELVELCKTPQYKKEGRKIIYGVLPAQTTAYASYQKADPSAYVCFPDIMFVVILNSFFHRLSKVLEYAEEKGFTYGCRHCPLNKGRFAAFSKGIIAAPDVIWSWGFNCDEGPKTDEMIQCMVGEDWEYIVSRLPHDTKFNHKDDEDDERISYVADIFKHDMGKVSEITGIYPSQENLKDAIDETNRMQFKTAMLIDMVCKADPPILGGCAIILFQMLFCAPFACGVKYVEEALDILLRELRQAIKEEKGILPKGSPKVATFFAPYVIPWVEAILRENGITTTYSSCLAASSTQLRPSNYPEDHYKNMAESFLRMSMPQNMGLDIASMIDKIETNKPEALIMGFFDFDRWLGAHHKMAAEIVQKETGVPHYYVEADFWDDRDYSPESLRTRLDSISQLVHQRHELLSE